ncbi:ABC transporter substrate-binding protein [Epibacterium ulvae]|uniref:ABC transporter substrate-binding protein n=1 Tax=Epibacterium ulvae TaxID=1156985 RepID=UPI001BFC5AA4|nr:ABC transporter substrate-binding protein [Epibacterium ulvae]MBT8152689.1 ABC transporter substrate-binding protein [Epibacterium ulvae]
MTIFKSLLAGAAIGLAISTSPMAIAATPDNVLVVAMRIDDITTLDPAESFEFAGGDVSRNVYMKLVNFDPTDLDAGYKPEIAESWTVSDDGTTITFKIKEGLSFHSGNPVTAEDVEFSLQRAVLLNKTPSFILTQFGFDADNVAETIKAEGDTVTLTTDQPYATSFVLNCLTATIGGIVDKKTALTHEVDGDMGNEWLKTNSAGSGAYSVQAWNPSDSVVMTANPDYYRGTPAMTRVIIKHVQESASQRLQLERGDIDVARNLNPEDVAGISSVEGVKIVDELKGRLMYLSLNQQHPVLSKPKVREAFKYLIDYEGMTQSFLKGQYTVHQNFLPQTYLGASSENPFALNLEKAKALLEEAGVDGLELTVGVREAQERLEIAQSFQNNAAAAGIKINLTVGTGKQILGQYRARELDVYLGAWGPDYPDPHTNAGTFAFNPDNSKEANATGLLAWRNGWDTAGLTEKTAAAVIENDRAVRAKLYDDIQAEFRESSPFIVMAQQIEQNAMNEKVTNFSGGQAITSASYWQVTK